MLILSWGYAFQCLIIWFFLMSISMCLELIFLKILMFEDNGIIFFKMMNLGSFSYWDEFLAHDRMLVDDLDCIASLRFMSLDISLEHA